MRQSFKVTVGDHLTLQWKGSKESKERRLT